MIAYLPDIYPDELAYSWVARYYAHMGYSAYTDAYEDLLIKRTEWFNVELIGRWNETTRQLIEKQIGMKKLIMKHTLYPQFARFETKENKRAALKLLMKGEPLGDTLRIPGNVSEQFLRYCPRCAEEDRKKYGETYWHRNHMLRGVSCCPKHGCKLKITNIAYGRKQSARLYIADEVIEDTNAEEANDITIKFDEFLIKVFQQAMSTKQQPPVGEFLRARLEGTPYISARGQIVYVTRLLEDVQSFYDGLANNKITETYQFKRIFSNKIIYFYELCQLAFFLNITVDELCHPALPEKSQTERFNERVAELNAQGKGMYRIAREVGCSPSCALRANRKRNKASHRHDVRKGMKERNWEELDRKMLPKVKELATEIYSGNGGRPRKVTASKIFRLLNEPVENSNMFPLCLEEINKYSETYEEYWARECVWAYKHLAELGRPITWSRMSKLLNLNKDNFLKCIPMLERYADEEMASIIGGLI